MHRGSVNKRSLDNEGDMDGFESVSNAKRHLGDDGQPTRVLLLRNLARGVTELDVEGFVHPFTRGFQPKVYLQASAGHAFVEFVDDDAATNALHYFRAHPIQLKGTAVHVTYSRRDAVTTLEEKVEPFRVLLASVTNLLYPVDIDLMHFLFSKHGQVEKIVTFSRTPTMYQALIQFQYPEDARLAMISLHNRNIYDGCNTLQIQPSKLQELVVKTNSTKSWDYTNADSGPPPEFNGRGGGQYAGANGGSGPGVLPTPGNMGTGGGYGQRGADHFNMRAACAPPAGPPGGFAQHGAYGMPSGSMRGNMEHPNLLAVLDKLPRELRGLNLECTNRNQTPVVICYNLPDCDMSVQKLFNLFSLYGTVLRIKVLREKADTALIQYSDPLYATIAFNFLQSANVMGHEIQISYSKNQEVKMPPPGNQETDDDTKRTRAFQIKDQRYGQGDDVEKYIKGACRPTQTLFVANVHEETTEEELNKAFSQYGTVVKFQFKSPKKGTKTQMAIVEMSTEVEALTALMHLHNTLLHGRYIKVAFSKTVLG